MSSCQPSPWHAVYTDKIWCCCGEHRASSVLKKMRSQLERTKRKADLRRELAESEA